MRILAIRDDLTAHPTKGLVMQESEFVEFRVMVSGGAGAFGVAIADWFANLGATVLSCDLDPAVQMLTGLRGSCGGRIVGRVADITSEEEVGDCVRGFETDFGPIGILVNAAGVFPRRAFDVASSEEWEKAVGINLFGAANCIRHVVPSMKSMHWGRIVSIVSTIGIRGMPGASSYAAAKAGIMGMSACLAKELLDDGILVNCIGPGMTESQMLRQALSVAEVEQIQIASGRSVGCPTDILAPLSLLVDPSAPEITGTTLWMKNPA